MKLELGTSSNSKAPYCKALVEILKLRKPLEELADKGVIVLTD